MREIKFRVWDRKKMIYINGMKYILLYDDGSGSIEEDGERLLIIHDDNPIMQFTGLFDKNGKEIYEGDIIYNDNHFGCVCGSGEFTDQYPSKRIIIWDNEYCQFKFEFVDINMKGAGCSGFMLCKKNTETEFEIIGNIYENPELL